MRAVIRLASMTAITAAVTAIALPASAAVTHRRAPQVHARGASPGAPAWWRTGARDAVFVQTDNPAGNAVVAYHRNADGTLSEAGDYPTGGLGGVLAGSVVDHLASQGSLGYDAAARLVLAVNAGSDTVSVFGVHGDRLHLRQVIGSGGVFPVSVAVHGDLVYVLNALGGGSVQGYRVFAGRLSALPGSSRALGLDPNASPQFTNTPGQVAFTPGGGQLIVTTKANGNDIDVFAVRPDGTLSPSPAVNNEPGTVPFAISFDASGQLVIADAGTNALSTFALSNPGTLTLLDTVGTGQSATCWVAPAGGYFFASNAGSASVSGYSAAADGTLTLLSTTGTDAGTVDAAASPDGRFLYVQTGGSGIVDEFSVGAGTLTEIGSAVVPGAAGGEGIVAT
jgi:DNA-binding beta-propeller fold protein YncE